jgi:hypothetical protein
MILPSERILWGSRVRRDLCCSVSILTVLIYFASYDYLFYHHFIVSISENLLNRGGGGYNKFMLLISIIITNI